MPRIHIRLPRHLLTVIIAAVTATIAVLIWPPDRSARTTRDIRPNPIFAKLGYLLQPAQKLEWMGYDALFAMRGPNVAKIDPRIMVVGYDHDTEGSLSPWPPPRRYHAQVINYLKSQGAALIIYDIGFLAASQHADDDRALNLALKNAGNVILACSINRDATYNRQSLVAPYFNETLGIDFEKHDRRLAFAEIPLDSTMDTGRVLRRMVPVMNCQDAWLPSLASAAYLEMMKGDGTAATPDGKEIEVTDRYVRLGTLHIPRTGPTAVDYGVNENKYAIPSTYIDFPGGSWIFPTPRFEQVCEGKEGNAYSFRGRIVFVGVTGTLADRNNDSFVTAYSHLRPEQSGGVKTSNIPGVIIHAQLLNALLHEDFITLLSGWQLWLMIFTFALIGTWGARQYVNWRGPVLLVGVLLAFLVSSYLLFVYTHLHLPYVIPNLLILITAGGVAWVERGHLRRKWSGYVSPAVLEQILRQEGSMGAQRYVASVIFGDIRAFTTFSEQHSPEQVVRLLNRHFTRLTRIIYAADGTIDKFLGDGILVVFGAPMSLPDATFRAVRASWLMREAALEPIIDDDGTAYTLATGFGITTGPFVAGHVGSLQRHEFTIIGDTVNLASRLQGVTGKPDVIIDAPTYDIVRAHVEVESLGEVTVKGKAQPVPAFCVTAWSDTPRAEAASEVEVSSK